MNYQLILTTH